MKKHLGTISALMCALLLAVPAIAAAVVNNDEVTSVKLKEADNNGSQNTNSGSGVKTGHIQDLAVTGAKIAAGTITSDKIQDGAVNSAKILDSSVGNADLATNAVTGGKIQDGTISSAKLSFAVYTKAEVDSLITGLLTQITDLQTRVATLESSPALALGAYVTVTAADVNGATGPNVVITGANLHVLNGGGATDGQVNGLGNLIIGYNEIRGGGDSRSGSHNLVVGSANNYSSYGGIVSGLNNDISNTNANVLGGYQNIASGPSSSVIGGANNQALSVYDSVYGGMMNTASGGYSVVIAGLTNVASGWYSLAAGGVDNQSTDYYATVSGGNSNSANGPASSVSGGLNRSTAVGGWNDWVAGSLFEDQ